VTSALLERILGRIAKLLSRFRAWHRFPFLVAVPTLVGLRANLRAHNLFDTERDPSTLAPKATGDIRAERQADGSHNDLGCPWMGMAGARFGRNVPIPDTFGEAPKGLYEPNPRLISRKLLAREQFVPVPHLSVLVPAWLQFMVHDWLSHGSNDRKAEPHRLRLDAGDDWGGDEMVVLRSRADPAVGPGDAGQPATYRNIETHWWDGSQVYGSSLARVQLVRTDPATGRFCADGKLWLEPNDMLPADPAGGIPDLELSGVNGNWWIGLSVMHTLFAREHNAIVDRIKADHPHADGEFLFQKARLVNAALMAKIHTVEWTPALLNSPEGQFIMRGNWWGVLGEQYNRAYGRTGTGDLLSGIPGSPAEHHAAPYAMTEEFTAVYRMHSLMPDAFSFRRHDSNAAIADKSLTEVAGGAVRGLYAQMSFDDALYSLATSNPGALVLHNFPNTLRRFDKKAAEGIFVDLGAVDVLRDRERGVPRYCAFRRHLGMRVPGSFEELTDDPKWRQELKDVYGAVENVDLLVGTLAERAPPGFGFSDTAFRIFILMASRRLKSDRFFTSDFTPEVYTRAGFDWIRDNGFRTVVQRHCPALGRRFADIRNMFFPWDMA